MTANITLEGIDHALKNLPYINKTSPKSKMINIIRSYYKTQEDLNKIEQIPVEILISNIWDIPAENKIQINSRKKNALSLKNTINKDLQKLFDSGGNPEGITISENNHFTMSDNAREKLLSSFTAPFSGDNDVSLSQISDVLKQIKGFVEKTKSASKDNDESQLDAIQSLLGEIEKGLHKKSDEEGDSSSEDIGEDGPGGEDDFEEVEIDDDEELEEIDEELSEEDNGHGEDLDEDDAGDDDEELEEIDEELSEEDDSDGEDSDIDFEEVEIDDYEEIEEIDENLDEEDAGDGEDSDLEFEEVEFDDDEELEEIDEELSEEDDSDGEDSDQDFEEVEIDDDEEIEEIGEDSGDGEDSDLEFEEVELDEDEEIEEIDEELSGEDDVDGEDSDPDFEEVELDDDEELEEVDENLDGDDTGDGEDSDLEFEEVELDEDEEIEEIDEELSGEDDGDGEDSDPDFEEVELDDDEELEEIDEDLYREDDINGEESDLDYDEVELDDDEEIIDEDELADSVQLDEDEELVDVEDDTDYDEDDYEEDYEEDYDDQEDAIELEEDEELVEADEIVLGEDEELVDEEDEEIPQGPPELGLPSESLGEFQSYIEQQNIDTKNLLSEKFDSYLGAMDRYYNQFLVVEEGVYTIGSPWPSANLLKERKAKLNKFFMGAFPVTNALFEIFVEKTGYKTIAEQRGYSTVFQGRYRSVFDHQTGKQKTILSSTGKSTIVRGACWYQPYGPESDLYMKRSHPVVQVTLKDALSFSAWIGKRLPTEYEWEAGARTNEANTFPWGKQWKESSCNIETSGMGGTTPVDEYQDGINTYGISDTLGNVWEWTTDTLDHGDKTFYLAKGGSFVSDESARLWSRFLLKPEFSANILGFRCVVD